MINPRPRAGFTLIELLTVIAIIGILAAIIIPTVGKVRNSARGAKCTARLREIGTASQIYTQENKGYPFLHREHPLDLLPRALLQQHASRQ